MAHSDIPWTLILLYQEKLQKLPGNGFTSTDSAKKKLLYPILKTMMEDIYDTVKKK
jgi:hypothetical protein